MTQIYLVDVIVRDRALIAIVVSSIDLTSMLQIVACKIDPSYSTDNSLPIYSSMNSVMKPNVWIEASLY